MTPRVPLRRALTDPALLGGALGGESWLAWRAILLAIMGEPLEPAELVEFEKLTGRSAPEACRAEEAWAIVGRRGGKSRSMSTFAVYLAALCDWQDRLAIGERGVVLLIAPDQRQAAICLDYASGLIAETPLLAGLLQSRTADSLSLSTGIDLEVRSASFRRLRGLTCVAVLADEAAFWMAEGSSNPDTEILNAVRPALATTDGPLIVISSPYAKRGEVFETFKRHYGPNGDPRIIVAQGASRDFNPSLKQSIVDRAMERDPAAARAEYLGQFRDDIAAFVDRAVVEACVDQGVFERPPVIGTLYAGFVDPSGGRSDSMTLSIAHREGDTAVIDLVREVKPPFSPEDVTVEFAGDLHRYGLRHATMDRFGAEWVRTAFERHNIGVWYADAPKSDLYLSLLPALNSGLVRLLDNQRVVSQLCALERRTARSGRDAIDHPPGAQSHDDAANAVAGAVFSVLQRELDEPDYGGIAAPIFPDDFMEGAYHDGFA